MEQFIVSARKYRPATFSTVVGQPSIAATLKNAIQRKQLAHAYLFCGPRGVGKTTCARIFAKTINCLNLTASVEACGECESCRSFSEGRSYSIHELDAASNNSVEDIRSLIEQVRIPPQIGKYSVYIIDEVHMLSAAAFNAFLKTLEEPPAHAIFILATTEKHKILPTILSRCQIYDFNRIKLEDTVTHLATIAKSEGVSCETEALTIIAQKADGAMRDALSIFDQVVAFCGTEITYAKVIANLNVLDYEYYFRLTDAFLAGDFADALMLFDEILSKGFEAQHFLVGLAAHFRDLLVCKDAKTIQLLEVGASIADRYREQSARCTTDFLFEGLALANTCDVGYKTSSNPRLHVELGLVKLSSIVEKKKELASCAAKEETPVAEEPAVAYTTQARSSKLSERITSGGFDSNASSAIQVKPASISIAGIKDLSLSAAMPTMNAKEEEATDTLAEEQQPFTAEELLKVWHEFAENCRQSRPRFANAMMVTSPLIENQSTVIFNVLNNDQKESVEQKIKPELAAFLRKELDNANITLEVRVDTTQHSLQAPLIYTNDDKLKHLCKKNPAMVELYQKLGLDFL